MVLREKIGILALTLLLTGCSNVKEAETDKTEEVSYDTYREVIERLDQVNSYHVTTQSYDHEYASEYQYLEEAESDVTVGEVSDTAQETIRMYFVYEDGTKEDVTCNSTELADGDQIKGCMLIHQFSDETLLYSDGYETSTESRMSAHYFMIMENLEEAAYSKQGNTWTIKGTSDADNDYIATLTVDEEGYPKTFTYAYDSLGISMTRTVSEIKD